MSNFREWNHEDKKYKFSSLYDDIKCKSVVSHGAYFGNCQEPYNGNNLSLNNIVDFIIACGMNIDGFDITWTNKKNKDKRLIIRLKSNDIMGLREFIQLYNKLIKAKRGINSYCC
jgi:hypothetical protein